LASNWWEGPSWLKKSQDFWPSQEPYLVDEDEVALEKKKTLMVNFVTPVIMVPRFSSYLKNVRVRAWIRRFINNSKVKHNLRNKKKYLSLEEKRVAEMDLIRMVQSNHYSVVPDMKALQVEKEADDLIHVKTRLNGRDDTRLFRSPILLPKDDLVVHQLISYVHQSNCHAGTQFVLGKIKEKFWIPQGRKTVSRVIHSCTICKRHNVKKLLCDPAPLPQARIQTKYAFQTTGVDLAGPLVLKCGKKVWVVIYTCAAYRGVFLDVVSSISSEEFLESLEKFTLSIGRPSTMYSDNGTNFVGARNLKKKVNYAKLEAKEINWILNPPTAAWWGGWWERLVRTMKDLLKRMIGQAKLTRRE